MKLSRVFKNSLFPTYSNSYQPYLLRKRALSIFCVAILGVNLLGSAVNSKVIASSVSSPALVNLLNEERSASGLNELKVDPKLVSAAYAKAEDIFAKQYWSHYGPNGETPWQFILGSDYDYVYAGENLAKGFNSAEGVHSAWMASKTHRENIMNVNYRDVGIAVVPGELNGMSCILVVQMFGSLIKDLPNQDTSNDENLVSSSGNSLSEMDIEITYPDSGDIVSDNSFKLQGEASKSIYSVQIYDNNILLGESICDEGVWDYRSDAKWPDGDHIVDVKDVSGAVSATVSFRIDTQPPQIDKNSISIQSVGKGLNSSLEVDVEVEGDPQDITFIVGDRSELLTKKDDVYVGKMNISRVEADVHSQIIASDEAGNYSVEDVSGDVQAVVKELDLGFWGSSLKPVTGINVFNKIFIITLGILLLINTISLFRMNILNNKVKTIFPMAIWIIIAGVLFFISSKGIIS